MNSSEIRSRFLNFFQRNDHEIKPSASLLPSDPGLLFNIAGMVPFKPYFLGNEDPPHSRLTTSQKCLRTEDIEQVGETNRHLTFFEMLGNFSFGDYFKEEAIQLAWKFLVKDLGLNPDRLWITVFKGDPDSNLKADSEAEEIWSGIEKVNPSRILHLGREENFWSMAETGPCGPCSEILYDQDSSDADPQRVKNLILAGEDRILELWNLVFMEFNREESGELTPLPQKNIDTGLGLERLASVMQDKESNFQTDLFKPILEKVRKTADSSVAPARLTKGSRVIADHIRASCFLLAEGLLPGNEGRGYVLRRLIRRALKWSRKLEIDKGFLSELVPVVVDVMGDHYQELPNNQSQIVEHLNQEEEQFSRTLDQGLNHLENKISEVREGNSSHLSGDEIYELYETHGLPIDIATNQLEKEGISYDEEEIQKAKKHHEERSRSSMDEESDFIDELDVGSVPESDFIGYDKLSGQSKIEALFTEDNGTSPVEEISDQQGWAVLNTTPFYPEGGGQVGDKGVIDGFKVTDTQDVSGRIIHELSPQDPTELTVGESVNVSVDEEHRRGAMRHHSSTHLLQAALRNELGEQVIQDGSLVTPDYLRFDFTHDEPVSESVLHTVEDQINDWIYQELPIKAEIMDREKAEKEGALAFFGEHYGDEVRVVKMGDQADWVSLEFCGGTHLENTREIGVFTILRETSVASGVRRIEAKAGHAAYQHLINRKREFQSVAHQLGIQQTENVSNRIEDLRSKIDEQEDELEELRGKEGTQKAEDLISSADDSVGYPVIVEQFDDYGSETLKEIMDEIRSRLENVAILLINESENQVQLLVGLNGRPTEHLNAGSLSNELGSLIDGGGGGRPDFAEAGGSNPDGIPDVIDTFKSKVGHKNATSTGD